MARVHQTGFEIGAHLITYTCPDVQTGAFSTSVVRSGQSSLAITFTAAQLRFQTDLSSTGSRYYRVYFRKNANPASLSALFTYEGAVADAGIFINASGQLELRRLTSGTIDGTSVALENDRWYRIEYRDTGIDQEALLDGVQFGLNTSGSGGRVVTALFTCSNDDSTAIFYFDDFACNDSTTSFNNSWCGEGKVVLLKPISDNQVGSWTGGAGGTTNLWNAVDNTPPVGLTTETNTSQIENNLNGGGTNYKPNLTTYASAGIKANDTITAIQGWVCHAEDINTGAKTGQVRINTNPVDSGFVTFTFGDDVGAAGDYPSNWRWKATTVVERPSVVLTTSPTMELDKTDTTTRVAQVCFMGAYVDYTPRFAPWTPAATPQNTLLRM